MPAVQAALEAGFTRIRPVLMTALAMIIGMVPMSLGLGEGGEQNAPLGTSRDWRIDFRDGSDAFLCALHFHHDSRTQGGKTGCVRNHHRMLRTEHDET